MLRPQSFAVLLVALLFWQVLAASFLLAQEKACEVCTGTRWIECTDKAHQTQRECGTKEIHLCPEVAKASCCYGLRKKPCSGCGDDKIAAEFGERRKFCRRWLKEVRKASLDTGNRFAAAQSKHFLVYNSIDKWRFQKRGTLKKIKAAHEFALRLDQAAEDFELVVGTLPKGPALVYVCSDLIEMNSCARALAPTEVKNKFPFRLRSLTHARYFCFPASPEMFSDKGIEANFYHHAMHMLLESVHSLGPTPPAWVHFGLAHWFEKRRFKGAPLCSNFCIQYPPRRKKWSEPKRWPKSVAKEVQANSKLSILSFCDMEGTKMDHRGHALAWSVIDFFIRKHPEPFKAFIRELKKGKKSREAITESTGMSFEDFNAAWRKWCRQGKLR